MRHAFKIILLLFITPLFLHAYGTPKCPYGEHFEQGMGQCIAGEVTPAPEQLSSCPAGMSMQYQGNPDSCAIDTPVASPGLFLADACGAGQRPIQGSIEQGSCEDMPNIPPVAYAGGDRIYVEGTSPVTLHGGGLDRDNDTITYRWVFLEKPAGSTAVLDDDTSANPSFIPDVPGNYIIQLIVNDGLHDSEPNIITIKINQRPIAVFTAPSKNIWGQDFDLNASTSFDPDGVIATYNWTPDYSSTMIDPIPAPDLGIYQYTLSVTDDDGATSPEVKRNIETIMCAGQQKIDPLDEVEGSINIDQITHNTESCYKIYLTSNNDTEQYAFYMNLFEGTTNNVLKNMIIKMYDQTGTEIHTFDSAGYMDYTGDNMKEQFEISEDSFYYLKISRQKDYAANYRFSIHPSLNNGLVQDSKGEINDFPEMATPLSFNAHNTLEDVSGTLNTTRQQDTSIKNTDDTDWYSIDIQDPGTYAFYMNLFNGTTNNTNFDMRIKIYNEDGTEVKIFDTHAMDYTDDHMKEQFTIMDPGKYYIYIWRKTGYKVNYRFSIHPSLDNGLVQDSKGEINDFREMATPLSFTNNSTDRIYGSLNITRQDNNSIKNTDDTDWYSLNIGTTGTYALDMDLTSGTATDTNRDISVIIYDQYQTNIYTFDTHTMDAPGDHMNESFDIGESGVYYIKIYRNEIRAAQYNFSIDLPI